MKKPLFSLSLGAALLCMLVLYSGIGKAPSQPALVPQNEKLTLERVRGESSTAPRQSYLSSIESQIAASSDKSGKAQIVSLMLEHLRKNPAKSVAVISNYLRSGADTVTGLPFELASGGKIVSAGSLRAILLAELAEFDSRLAAALSREILNHSASQEEWAIALRNYAWGTDNSREDRFLAEKTAELINRKEWIAEPGVAFLEAFDLIPYTRNVELVKPLLSLTSENESAALRHASFLALDKLTQEAPLAVVEELSTVALSGGTAPIVRSSLMARLDPSDKSQSRLLAQYLSAATTTSGELTEFYRLFPLTSNYVGTNLVTDNSISSFGQMAQRDHAAAELLNSFRKDSRFSEQSEQIDQALKRLQKYLRTASLNIDLSKSS